MTPYDVERKADQLHYTYLDTVGRPVVVIEKKNTVDNHIQDFKLKYKFSKWMILQEPLLVVGFFYLLFTLVIILCRIDFSISASTPVSLHINKRGFLLFNKIKAQFSKLLLVNPYISKSRRICQINLQTFQIKFNRNLLITTINNLKFGTFEKRN